MWIKFVSHSLLVQSSICFREALINIWFALWENTFEADAASFFILKSLDRKRFAFSVEFFLFVPCVRSSQAKVQNCRVQRLSFFSTVKAFAANHKVCFGYLRNLLSFGAACSQKAAQSSSTLKLSIWTVPHVKREKDTGSTCSQWGPTVLRCQ